MTKTKITGVDEYYSPPEDNKENNYSPTPEEIEIKENCSPQDENSSTLKKSIAQWKLLRKISTL